jgi:hypothetical protein
VVTKKEEVDEKLRKIDKTLCNLYIYEDKKLLETFRNLSLNESSSRFIRPVLESGSEFVTVVKVEGVIPNADIPDDNESISITTPDIGGDGDPITATEIQGTANPNEDYFYLKM